MMFQRAAEHASIVAAWRSQPTCATRRCKELGSEAVEERGEGEQEEVVAVAVAAEAEEEYK